MDGRPVNPEFHAFAEQGRGAIPFDRADVDLR
jgi:hypothetical protein